MFASILSAIVALFQAIPIIARYFPPKTEAEQEAALIAKIEAELKAADKSGRPGPGI